MRNANAIYLLYAPVLHSTLKNNEKMDVVHGGAWSDMDVCMLSHITITDNAIQVAFDIGARYFHELYLSFE